MKDGNKLSVDSGLSRSDESVVSAAGNANYKAGTKTVTVTVKVS